MGRLRRGDVVALRPPAEILMRLDAEGREDGLILMPEMLSLFGRTFTVKAQLERVCDVIEKKGPHRIPGAVVLEGVRCDGGEHDGCQARCLTFFKEEWLQRVEPGESLSAPAADDPALVELLRRTRAHVRTTNEAGETTYRCQATRFLDASELLRWWDVRSFLRQLTGGNVRPRVFLSVVARIIRDEIGRRRRSVHPYAGPGNHMEPSRTDLRPGQRVRVRPVEEIVTTLDERARNRGLLFDREMTPFCGETHEIERRVEHFIDEVKGTMVDLTSDCVMLKGVVCGGHLSEGRWFCPRGIPPWWREAWLVPEEPRAREGASP